MNAECQCSPKVPIFLDLSSPFHHLLPLHQTRANTQYSRFLAQSRFKHCAPGSGVPQLVLKLVAPVRAAGAADEAEASATSDAFLLQYPVPAYNSSLTFFGSFAICIPSWWLIASCCILCFDFERSFFLFRVSDNVFELASSLPLVYGPWLDPINSNIFWQYEYFLGKNLFLFFVFSLHFTPK